MRSPIAIFLGLWLAACQGSYEPADRVIQREFPQVRVSRIGDIGLAYTEYADIAVLNALEAALGAGVPRQALREATVAPVAQTGVARLSAPGGYATYYDVWIAIEGCASAVSMKANFAGRLFGLHDPAGCLGRARAPAAAPSN